MIKTSSIYRMPAEWELHVGTWLTWPHNPETWPEQSMDQVELDYLQIAKAIAQEEKSNILVQDKSAQDKLYKNLTKYFNELNKIANKLDIEIDFIVTHPYWVYSIDKKNNKLLLNKELNEKVEKLICSSFHRTKKISKVLISQVAETLELNDLTIDKRHLKSTRIKLTKYQEICVF